VLTLVSNKEKTMKKYHNYIKSICLLWVATLAMSSCQDWLTVYPQTQIVEENFWEDKNDLEGVRYAAYKQMCNTLEKIVLWGDLRSDSYTLNGADESTSTQQLYQEIRDGRIDRDSAKTYFDWGGFYTTINYCNKVLQHGPEVLQNDKQFTSAEWSQMYAEITTLRALNYFYLIRAFKDVPYSTKVINNDTEVEAFGATNQLVILDSLIVDVEKVQGRARNRFSSSKDTKGMITNAAIYALLSDMYLWRASLHQGRDLTTDTVYITNVATQDSSYVIHSVQGDYQKCIDYADLALAALAKQNEENNKGYGKSTQEMLSYGLTNVSLYKNTFENFTGGNPPRLTAYNQIFSEGNSDESIFELQFNNSDSRSNDVVTSQWGYSTSVHLATNIDAFNAVYGNSDELNRDSRMWFSVWQQVSAISGTTYPTSLPGYYCFKWRDMSVIMPTNNPIKCKDIDIIMLSGSDDGYRNWIIYRISDVMLQKAEALAALDQGVEAMKYVNAIHRRWHCNDSESSSVQPSEDVTSITVSTAFRGNTDATLGNLPAPSAKISSQQYEIAVLNERQLEFVGEGKRWFDLVRYAERHAGGQDGTKDPREWSEERPIGSGTTGVNMMIDQFLVNSFDNVSPLKNRFRNRYGLYNIIYYMEIKASDGKLEQNPVWNKSTYDK